MSRTLTSLAVTAGLLVGLSVGAASQSAELRVVDASPNGELNQLTEANEVRIVFSEPMVSLGRIPSNPAVPFVRISPAIAGAFRWSGTTILIFTPDPAAPLPNATRYTVTVDASATSASGRKLSAPHTFAFTTPTVRLTSMQWYRQQGSVTAPVTLILDFNQKVRPADILAHAVVRYLPHEWDPPMLTERERARMTALEPNGVPRFDAKVASARQAASRSDLVAARVATDWDRKQYPAAETRVVLETTAAPVAGGWLQLTLDTQTPSAEGPARPPQPLQSVAQLAEVFFARPFGCTSECEPSRYNAVGFTTAVRSDTFAAALRVTDITDPARERTVAPTTKVTRAEFDYGTYRSLEDAGFERQPPVKTYAYRLDPALRSEDGQTLGYPWIGIIENWHEFAFVSFGDGHGVWEKDGGAQLPFYGRNFRSATQWATRLTPQTLIDRIRLLRDNELPPGSGTVRKLNVTPDTVQSHGLDISGALAAGGTGVIWTAVRPTDPLPQTRASRANVHTSAIVQVTNLGITVKDSPQSTLLFVTRLDNGEPVASAAVSLFSIDNKQVWRGQTGADGVAMAPALPLRKPDDWYKLSFVATAEKDGDLAYVNSDWNEGILPWEYDASFQLWESTDILRGSVFTDRGVYKPGEDVHFKAIVRADTPQGVRLLPAGQALDVVVRDNRGREIDRRSVTLSRWSSVEWAWPVPAEGTLGNYNVQVSMPGAIKKDTGNDVTPRPEPQGEWLKQVGGSFLVAAYRRPDFRVDTTLTAPTPIAGADLSGTVDAKYLFGGNLARRPVKWSLTSTVTVEIPQPILEKFPGNAYAFGYYPDDRQEPKRVAGETVALDAEGRLSSRTTSERGVDVAQSYLFEADVEDISRQHIANRSRTVVHPAPFYVGMKRPSYFADVTTGTSVDVVVVGLDGAVVTDMPVTLKLTRIQWNSVRRSEGGGFYTWDTERVEVPAGEWTVISGATAKTQSIPVPEGGYYQLSAEASDAAGHRTRTETSFYGLGKGYTAWERFDHNRITLEPERKTWKPGETARIMVQSPWESATALMTVEREGVRSYKRFALTSTQQTVEVPITEDDIPNLYVSVLLIRGRTSTDPGTDGSDPGKPAFKLGYTEIAVEDATKRLKVEVSADRSEYRPAKTAKVSLAVSDAAGRGTSSEITLWAVDYGVLSLTEYQAPDVLKSVYRDKALQVLTEDNRQRIISRRVITPKGDGEGGGGGNDANAFRKDFRPLAFWLGSVETDARGRATREVKLPESLTTYRIMAVAADTASRFGSGKVEIKVNKPINLLPTFPRFLTLGDRASFGATVASALTAAGRATVTIRSLDPSLLTFAGNASQTIELGAGGSESVRFDAQARAIGSARVQMTVRVGNETDAFESTIGVQAPAPIETSAAFGEATDARAIEKLALPATISPAVGGINVDLSSTALVGLGEGVRYLTEYGFFCAEQKASAALALSLSADLGGAFSMANIAPADYKTRATALIASLEKYRCGDGGYGYWGPCAISNAYLTAYVLHVRKTAHDLGVGPEISPTDPALNILSAWLRRDAPLNVQRQPWYSATATYLIKTLAENNVNQDANINRILPLADRMPIFALNYLADAMAAKTPKHPRYDDVVRRLTNALKIEGDQAHAEEIDDDQLWFLWNSNVRSSALVLKGLVQRGDDPVHVPRLVRWLLAARTNGRWGNTQENAMALEALVAYYKKYEADVPDMTATVTLGTRAIGTATFRGRSSASQQVRLAMPDLLRQVPLGAERDLAFSRAGTGRLYYATRVQFAPTAAPPSIDNGMRIERRYERYNENGAASVPATSFAAGDLIRVTLTLTLPAERRYVAVVDAMPAGVEAVDSWFSTTASDMARDSSRQTADQSWEAQFRGGAFDHVEKYDDRVTLFATRLSEGKHEFSYIVRATTAGTFNVTGTTAEQMYAPEVKGRAAAAVVTIK
ncbi:MAG TPA: MG2 domain-containing protein [Vicinamibacterales bacterium]|nr:MG2 domain-containing protein [Vicinamibacterales bacterium]